MKQRIFILVEENQGNVDDEDIIIHPFFSEEKAEEKYISLVQAKLEEEEIEFEKPIETQDHARDLLISNFDSSDWWLHWRELDMDIDIKDITGLYDFGSQL